MRLLSFWWGIRGHIWAASFVSDSLSSWVSFFIHRAKSRFVCPYTMGRGSVRSGVGIFSAAPSKASSSCFSWVSLACCLVSASSRTWTEFPVCAPIMLIWSQFQSVAFAFRLGYFIIYSKLVPPLSPGQDWHWNPKRPARDLEDSL